MSSIISSDTVQQVQQGVRRLLADFQPDPKSPLGVEIQQALFLARALQQRATELQTPQERHQQAELDRMIHNPGDKATLMQLTDQAFRSQRAPRAADQLIHILDVQGIPRFFSMLDRTLLKGFQSFGAYLPGVAVPLVKEKMQHETANVILPAEPDLLREHLEARRDEGVRMNVNYLGEALLGEREAERRLQDYLAALEHPEIEVISVKISTIYSQISALAREHTIGILCDRMEKLYRAAAAATFQRRDGTRVPKFVYLDMEEYRDKEITAEVFMRTLDRPGLESARAGIALQAYIPDSFAAQKRINQWARQRVEAGGAPITIRLVKGANMEMERVDASLRGWPQAPYQTKQETDANYLRMMHEGMAAENIAAVRLGIASHNLLTLAYGLVLATRLGIVDRVQFEMLEGMANHQRRALFELSQNVLLYAAACRQEEFTNAIGYLIRRLDENTGPDNFLRHAFHITVGSPEWTRLERQFVDALDAMHTVSDKPRRTQDRSQEPSSSGSCPLTLDSCLFRSSPDTDWSLVQNGQWAESIITEWQGRHDARAAEIPLVVAGKSMSDGREIRPATDPSKPGVVVARYRYATEEDARQAVDCAKKDPDLWRTMTADGRDEVLFRAADELSAARGRLMGAMLADGGKVLSESDPEVSEAVDFCRFYAQAAKYFHELPGMSARGKGVVVVVSPWNFPLAIPCGGIAAALAAGNTVILKPASDTVLVAYEMCQCFWRAGVSQRTLQFLPSSGSTVGQQLVTHNDVDAVILTGGTETARRMLAAKPTLPLFAETGGKNATIVTALSDRDQAIKNVLHSAFSHSGQKCSATSLLLLEDEVYHDPKFREAFCDAVESLAVGSAWDVSTKVGPLIRPPSGSLERGLTQLESGESWAVAPRIGVDGNPNLVSPGVKWGVQPGSFTHCTELFGPVLGVMPFADLEDAIELVNATGYGLTSGLESLDDREHAIWRDAIRAGNLYINRPTTGAIVLRQPFGGMGKSHVGPGIKTGGPNYVAQFMRFSERGVRTVFEETPTEAFQKTVLTPYSLWAREEFQQPHDDFRLVGEDNFRRYLPVENVRIRVHPDDSLFEILSRVAAASVAGCRIQVSTPKKLSDKLADSIRLVSIATENWPEPPEIVAESDEELADLICRGETDRVRYARPERVPEIIRRAAAEALQYVADEPVSAHGRIELLWYVREQSISHVYHRYGNLGIRANEPRAEEL
jgi:RHH-type proline utilization regulon transcriptional repressor/proline dehydrogenase/delta 1-pyrroline-5-carboxylate dehydrogenase